MKPKSWDSSAASSALSTSHHSLAAQEAGQTHSRLSAMDDAHAEQLHQSDALQTAPPHPAE